MVNYERIFNVSKDEQRKAEAFGGVELSDWCPDEESIGADKFDHRSRSLAHQPNHTKHWQKLERR